jgi:hypothetical protein
MFYHKVRLRVIHVFMIHLTYLIPFPYLQIPGPAGSYN